MKKTITTVLLLIAAMMIFCACGAGTPETSSETQEKLEGFSLCFSWWVMPTRKNVMDTKNGFLQKDMIKAGTLSTDFEPEEKFLEDLRDIVLRYDLESIHRRMTAEVLSRDDTTVTVEPNTYYEISVTMDGKSFTVGGDLTASYYKDKEEDAKRFMEAVAEIRNELDTLMIWKALPEPSGSYE